MHSIFSIILALSLAVSVNSTCYADNETNAGITIGATEIIAAIITVVLSSLCILAVAADRFIVKYKLTESQKSFALSYYGSVDTIDAKAWIRKELAKNLSFEHIRLVVKSC